jgi:uncharacterized Zn finger protein
MTNTLTLQDLISLIPVKILNRGQEYFEDGNILEMNQDSNGTWYAVVEGNYGDYEVEIEIDGKGNVGSYYCDCPYDEYLCKHIAAVALAIAENNTISISPIEEQINEDWKHLIQKAKADDLRNFMLDFGQKNHEFRHQVELTFSKPETVQSSNNIAYYQNQVSGVFDSYGYDDYLDYRRSHEAMRDINHFLSKADNYYEKGNLNEAFCIAAAIVTEAIGAIQYMDDSSGECSAAISGSLQVIENVFDNTNSEELQNRLFEWLHKQIQNMDSTDYGMDDHLEPLFFKTAISLKKQDIAYQIIDQQLTQLKAEDGWSKSYYKERYLSYKIDLLNSEGKKDEANEIIDQNLQFEEFRQIRVNEALNTNNYANAEKLLLEGIQIAKKDDLPGVVHKWKDQLLNLFKQQNNSKEYNRLARELFVENTWNIRYFRIFKKTTSGNEWAKQRDSLISELKNKKRGYFTGTSSDDMAQIYIEEQMLGDLFELVRKSGSIHTIIRYTDYLKDDYSADLIGMYKNAIEGAAVHTGRHVYVELVDYLKKMAKLKGGLKAAKLLKESLLDKYKNRPAMKDEFKKLNWN